MIAGAASFQWRRTAESALPGDWLGAVKVFINRPLEDTFFDNEVADLVAAARRAVEQHCRLALAPATWVGTCRELPRGGFRLREPRPFASVDKIEIVDPSTGTISTVDPATYAAFPEAQLTGSVELGDGCAWPPSARRPDAVRITVKTGFYDLDGTTPMLPDDLRHALMMTVASLDAQHGDASDDGGSNTTVYALKNVKAGAIPQAAQVLLAPYVYRFLTFA